MWLLVAVIVMMLLYAAILAYLGVKTRARLLRLAGAEDGDPEASPRDHTSTRTEARY